MADDGRYQVVVSAQVRRALSETLPSAAAFAVFEFLDGPLADHPRRVGAPLRAPFDGLTELGGATAGCATSSTMQLAS